MSTERVVAIREAVHRAAREKRQRETPPEHHARLEGRYRGKVRAFDLVWDADECGYRRVFARDSAALWEEVQVFSDAEVQALTRTGAWCGSGSAHHVTVSVDRRERTRSAKHTSHQRGGLTEGGGRHRKPRSEEGRTVCASSKIDMGPRK